jgi:hypothetical protein
LDPPRVSVIKLVVGEIDELEICVFIQNKTLDILWVEQFYAAPGRFNPQYLLQIENIDVKNFNL